MTIPADFPLPSPARVHFPLDPGVVFLNHGSFGSCPHAVLAAQQALRLRMEAEPVRFFIQDLPGLIGEARQALAGLVNAPPDDLVFMPNATAGVNTVLRGLDLRPGDELVVTDHEYNACRNALDYTAKRSGAHVVVARVPFPLPPGAGAEAVIRPVAAAMGPRTRLLLIDHVTSPTGMVLPLRDLVRAAHARGVDVLVDGAHAPGMVPIDIAALGVAYYTGNCHKWLCAPKGAAFLYVRRDRQEGLHPLSISHGYNAPVCEKSRFLAEFDWTGTADPTPALCVPAALRFLDGLIEGGLPALQRHNRESCLAARRTLCEALGVPLPCPDEMIGSLASLPLPDGEGPLQEALLREFSIQVPVVPWPAPPQRLLRISAQVYNSPAQYEYLGRALRGLLQSSAPSKG